LDNGWFWTSTLQAKGGLSRVNLVLSGLVWWFLAKAGNFSAAV